MIERVMSKNYAAITVSSNKETRKTYAAKANSPRVLVLPRRRNEHARRREIIVLKNRVPSRVLTRSVLVKNGNEDDDGDDGMIETFDSGKTSITMYNEDLAPVLMRNRSFGFIVPTIAVYLPIPGRTRESARGRERSSGSDSAADGRQFDSRWRTGAFPSHPERGTASTRGASPPIPPSLGSCAAG